MSRLIDADAIPYTMLYKEDWLKGTGAEKPGVWKDTIDAMPTIQPERKKGKWIEYNATGKKQWMCSECCAKEKNPKVARFCYWCGADMRGDSE